MKTRQIQTNGIALNVIEQGEGPAVLLCHGFPDTSRTWKRQMEFLAEKGFRAIAPDMRGFGGSDAPDDPASYTHFEIVGDLVGLLDALEIPTAVVIGHDWGANIAWHAGLFRPDRFIAVFGISVPHTPRGRLDLLDAMRAKGHADMFYMLEQARPETDATWSDAATTIPGALYWASGTPAPADRWDPLDPSRALYRAAPAGEPAWADPDYVAHNVASFARTGFHGGLNYYRAIPISFRQSAAFLGGTVRQPSFYVTGAEDGLKRVRDPSESELRAAMPGLLGTAKLEGVGHWPQHEAPDALNTLILDFLTQVGGG